MAFIKMGSWQYNNVFKLLNDFMNRKVQWKLRPVYGSDNRPSESTIIRIVEDQRTEKYRSSGRWQETLGLVRVKTK